MPCSAEMMRIRRPIERSECTEMNARTLPLRLASLLPLMALCACAGSQRFTGPGAAVARAPVYNEFIQSAPPIQSAPVTAEPLPPPGGYPVASAPPANDPFFDPQAAPPGQQPPVERVIETPPQQRNQVANANPGAGAGAGSSRGGTVASRDGVVGNWTAQEATGARARYSCRARPRSISTAPPLRAAAIATCSRSMPGIIAMARSISISAAARSWRGCGSVVAGR